MSFKNNRLENIINANRALDSRRIAERRNSFLEKSPLSGGPVPDDREQQREIEGYQRDRQRMLDSFERLVSSNIPTPEEQERMLEENYQAWEDSFNIEFLDPNAIVSISIPDNKIENLCLYSNRAEIMDL